MNLSIQENQLFEEWKRGRKSFVADGAVDWEAYAKSKPKLVFVLKEVNSDEWGWDLREFLLKRNERHQTWNNVARWVLAIRNLKKEWPWQDLEKMDRNKRIEILKSLCVINLRKSPGGHTSNHKRLVATAKEDKAFINRQFLLYDPDLTICCGKVISDVFNEIIDFGNSIDWKTTSRGIPFHQYQPGKFVVSYSHPEARVQDNILCYGLIDAIKEISKTTNIPAKSPLL